MKRNVPKLRFKGFDDEWKIVKLDEGTYIKGRIGWKNLKQEEYTEKGPYLIAGKHIRNGKINWDKCDHISEDRYEESMEIALENGDIIFSKDGSIGNPALIKDLNFKATINGTMMLIRLDKKVYYPAYFYQILQSVYFEKLIRNVKSGSSIPHIFQRDMIDFKFPMTSLQEQEKIANFLTKVDSLIEEQDGKVKDLELYKKGMMQKIFSQEIRFKDDNGCEYPEWLKVKVGDCFNERSQKGFANLELLSVSINGGVCSRNEIDAKDNSSNDKSNYKIVEVSDIVYNSMRMWQGASGVSGKRGIVSPAYTVLIPKEDVNSIYFGYLFKWNKIIYEFRKYSQGLTSDTWNLKYPQIKDIKVKLPCLKEQTKIANFLYNIDSIIEQEKSKLQDLRQWKKGLLQQMFV